MYTEHQCASTTHEKKAHIQKLHIRYNEITLFGFIPWGYILTARLLKPAGQIKETSEEKQKKKEPRQVLGTEEISSHRTSAIFPIIVGLCKPDGAL